MQECPMNDMNLKDFENIPRDAPKIPKNKQLPILQVQSWDLSQMKGSVILHSTYRTIHELF